MTGSAVVPAGGTPIARAKKRLIVARNIQRANAVFRVPILVGLFSRQQKGPTKVGTLNTR
jgi:hypothetical protein